MTVNELNARTLGLMIALYERAVGLYASLVGINAYHQPGVEAGKKAATGVIALQQKLVATLQAAPGQYYTAEAAANSIGGSPELAYKILDHLAANGAVKKQAQTPWFTSTFSA